MPPLYGAMKDAGKSPKTIRNHHAIIATALHQGVRWGWVRTNVAEMAKPPRVSQSRVTAPSLEVVREVIEGAERRDPRLAPLLMLAALTGMRRRELCALRRSDVDLSVGTIDVAKSLVVAPGGLVEKSTKTNRGRLVALDPVGVALLTRHRSRAEHWIAEAGSELPPDAFVFSPFPEGTTSFRPDNLTSFFIRVRNEIGAPTVRLHDLRHFTATQLIGAGVDVRTVAGRLGHSDPSVTLRPGSTCSSPPIPSTGETVGGSPDARPIRQAPQWTDHFRPRRFARTSLWQASTTSASYRPPLLVSSSAMAASRPSAGR